jgi:hypothetical protein
MPYLFRLYPVILLPHSGRPQVVSQREALRFLTVLLVMTFGVGIGVGIGIEESGHGGGP